MDLHIQLEQQLQTVVQSTDTQQIKAATAALNTLYSNPQSVPALMHVVVNGRPEIRQIAAVEMRKKAGKWWSKLEDGVCGQIKQALVELLLKESDKKLRHAIARIVSEIALVELPAGKWQDLLQIVNTCTVSQNVLDREVGFFLIFALLDVIPETFSQHLSQLLNLFGIGLQDSSEDVKSYTLSSLSKLTDIMEPSDSTSLVIFKKLIPGMVSALQHFIETGNDEKISTAMDCFTTIISSDIPVFNQNISELVQFFLTIGSNQNLEDEVRTQGLSILMWVILFKKNKILRLKLIEPLIVALMNIGCEDEPEDLDEDSPARLSMKVLNTLSSNVSPQQVFPVTWKIIAEFSTQASVGHRKSAMSGLASVSEGCSDYIRNEFKVANIVPFIVNALKDSEISVRRASLIALSALTNDMGSEVCEFHSSLLGLVFGLLGDANEQIRKIALETLDVLLEHMGDAIKPYLNDLMQQLIVALDNTDASQDVDNMMTIISAIGSAAHASESEFITYFAHVQPRIEKYMNLQNKENEDEMNLRVCATDAMGAIAIAVGKDAFGPHLQKSMETVMNGLLLGAGRLPEAGFLFFGMMAKVFGSDFQPYISTVMESLFTAAQVSEADASFENEEDLDIEEMDEELAKKYRINSAIADEKEAAMDSLGVIVESTKEAFIPFLQSSLSVVQELCDHSHDGVRKAAVEAFFKITRTVFKIYHEDLKWVPGLPATYTLHNDVAHLVKILMDEVVRVFDEEDEIMAVSNAAVELLDTIRQIGPILVANHIEALGSHISNILNHKAVCQIEFDNEEDEIPDEEAISEFDSLLISTIVDLIGGLAQAVGEPFAPYFGQFWKQIMSYFAPQKPVADRSMVVGVIGEIANGIKCQISPYTKETLEICVAGLEDPDAEVRSNAAYAVGNICMYTTVDVTPYYPAILQKLAPLFYNQPMPNVIDNACGAVCRMIIANPSTVPLDQVLPVIVQNLPLKKDFAENEPVYECFSKLLEMKHPNILQHSSALVNSLASAIHQQQLNEKCKIIVSKIIETINQMDSGAFQTVINAMQQDERNAILSLR